MHQQDPALPSQSVIPPATTGRLQPHGSRVLPVKSSALKLPDRFRVKLVFAASFPPSTASWDTTFLLLVSAVRRGKKQNRTEIKYPGVILEEWDFSPRVWGTTHRQKENCIYPLEFLLCSRNWYTYSGDLFLAFHSSATGTFRTVSQQQLFKDIQGHFYSFPRDFGTSTCLLCTPRPQTKRGLNTEATRPSQVLHGGIIHPQQAALLLGPRRPHSHTESFNLL